jgi:phosphonate transport system substrate-binding protein
VISKGDDYYQALVIGTSKYTGSVNLPSVLVVRRDDPAQSFDDLAGTEFGYINNSCSSSFYAMSVLLEKQGRKLNDFLKPKRVKAWQGQIDAVIAKEVRSTMLPEDVWLATASNADDTKIIGRYDNAKPALIVARKRLDEQLSASLTNALVTWAPPWNGLYGPFRPYYLADVFSFYHDLDQLAALVSGDTHSERSPLDR